MPLYCLTTQMSQEALVSLVLLPGNWETGIIWELFHWLPKYFKLINFIDNVNKELYHQTILPLNTILKGDKVMVISGDNKGDTGIVQQIPTKENRAIVEGIRMVKTHQTNRKQSGRYQMEAPFTFQKLMLVDPKSGKPTRVGRKGLMVRVSEFQKNPEKSLNNELRTHIQKQIQNEVVKELQEKFQYKSSMQVPKLLKICLNQGVGAATQDKKKKFCFVRNDYHCRTKAVPTKATKSVSNFKLRGVWPSVQGLLCATTGMYEFLERLVTISLPKGKGLSKESTIKVLMVQVTTQWYNWADHLPEIDIDKVNKITGMDIICDIRKDRCRSILHCWKH